MTLSGVKWTLEIYVIWYLRPHFSSVDTVLCIVDGVKSQPFLKCTKVACTLFSIQYLITALPVK